MIDRDSITDAAFARIECHCSHIEFLLSCIKMNMDAIKESIKEETIEESK